MVDYVYRWLREPMLPSWFGKSTPMSSWKRSSLKTSSTRSWSEFLQTTKESLFMDLMRSWKVFSYWLIWRLTKCWEEWESSMLMLHRSEMADSSTTLSISSSSAEAIISHCGNMKAMRFCTRTLKWSSTISLRSMYSFVFWQLRINLSPGAMKDTSISGVRKGSS